MSMKNIADALYLCYRAKVPVMLEGVHGIGKTSLAYQLHARIAAEKKQDDGHALKSTLDGRELAHLAQVDRDSFGLWAVSAANLTIEELIGYPNVNKDGALHYLRSHNFIPPPDHRGGGIWNIDELNLSFQEVSRAVMSIALEGRYLDYVLPEDIFIITSQNPAAGEYQSRRLDPPTLNRFCVLKAITDNAETLAHFMARDFHPSILDALGEHAETILNPHQKTCEFNIEQVPTSRSWEYVDRMMKVATPEEVARIGLMVFSGVLGPSSATVFQKFATEQGERSIPIDDVLKDYGYDPKTYDPDKTGFKANEAMGVKAWPMTAVRKKVRRVTKQASVRMDIINLAITALCERLGKIAADIKERSKDKKGVNLRDIMTETEKCAIVNAYAFLCDLPSDQSGPTFLRKVQGDTYDYTIRPFARDLIASDYEEHWDETAKQVDEDTSAKSA